MSGLELLFLDGGTTVAGIVGAGATALGFRQHRRDADELALPEELPALRQMLRQAHASVEAGHLAFTAVWQSPLSLFGPKAEKAAEDRGVPTWAIAAVCKARRLVEKAAELGDLTDVYEAQLMVAERECKGVQWVPVRALEARLDHHGLQLTTHVPVLIIARDAFDATSGDSTAASSIGTGGLPARQTTAQAAAGLAGNMEDNKLEELPIAILRDRGALGELWGSVNSVGKAYGEALQRAVARRTGDAEEVPEEPPELSPWVQAYM